MKNKTKTIKRLQEIREELTSIYMSLGNPEEISADSVLNKDIDFLLESERSHRKEDDKYFDKLENNSPQKNSLSNKESVVMQSEDTLRSDEKIAKDCVEAIKK